MSIFVSPRAHFALLRHVDLVVREPTNYRNFCHARLIPCLLTTGRVRGPVTGDKTREHRSAIIETGSSPRG